MNTGTHDKTILKLLAVLAVFAIGAVLFIVPSDLSCAATAGDEAVVVVTGDQIIKDGVYTSGNISREKSYPLSELKQLAARDSEAAPDNTYIYSARNNYDNLNIYKVQGVRMQALMDDAGIPDFAGKYAVRAQDGYEIVFDPAFGDPNEQHDADQTPSKVRVSADVRYYYPQIWRAFSENADRFTDEEKREGAQEVPSVIGWAAGGSKENGNNKYVDPASLDLKDYDKSEIKLSVGQLTPEDYNNPLWNGPDKGLELIAGEPLAEALAIDNQVKGNVKKYSRADIMVRGGTARAVTWLESGTEKTIWCRGVTLSSLIGSNPYYLETTKIVLTSADGTVETLTGAETLAKFNGQNTDALPMLCYETGSSEAALSPVLFEEADGTQSFFTVCVNGHAPIERVTGIRIFNDPPEAPDMPGNLKVRRSGYDSLKISWTQAGNGTNYEIFCSTAKKDGFKSLATVGQVSQYTDTKLKTGQTYYYKIRTVTTDPKTGLSSVSTFTTEKSAVPSLDKPVIKTIGTGKKAVTLKWGKVSGANGYKVYRATKKNGKYKSIKTISNGKTLSFKNTKLKKGQKYYFKIRAFRNVSGKPVYSNYSAVKYIKVK